MAIVGLTRGLFMSTTHVCYQPDRFARSGGCLGCLFGTVISGFFVLAEAIKAVLVFLDRLAIGITNGIFRQDFDYLIDQSWKPKVFRHKVLEAELEQYMRQGIPRARRQVLTRAFDFVSIAHAIFNSTKPSVPSDHGHFSVANMAELIEAL